MFIDGDALIKQVFEDVTVDLDEEFKLLSAVALLEKRLLRLKHLNYHIVFVESHAPLSVRDSASRALARACIIEHLTSITSISIHEFVSLDSKECRDYLDVNRPYFVLTSDGAGVVDAGTTSSADERTLSGWRAASYSYLQRGMDVAFLESIEYFDGKIFAFSIARDSEEIFTGDLNGDDALKLENVTSMMQDVDVNKTSDSSEASALTDLPTIESGDERRSATFASLRAMKSTEPFFVQAVLYSLVQLEEQSLDQRAFISASAVHNSEVQQFLEAFYRNCTLALKQRLSKGDAISADSKLSDIFDTNIFADSLLQLCSSASLAAEDSFSKVQKQYEDFAGVSLETAPLPQGIKDALQSKKVNGKDASLSVSGKPLKKGNKVLPFSDPLFDRYLDSIKLDATAKESITDAIDFSSIPQQVGKRVAGMEKKLLEKEKGPELTGVRKEDIWIKKRFQANKDRQMAHIKRAAESLTGANGTGLERQAIISGQTPAPTKSQKSTPTPSRSSTPVPTDNSKL